MPNLRVDTIKSQDGTKGPTFDGDLEFTGTSYTVLPKGTTAERPTGVAAGSMRFNTDTKLVEQYNGTEWVTLNSYGVGRGVFGGGRIGTPSTPPNINTIDYVTISTTGNASDFGDLSQSIEGTVACSSSTRGVLGGGYTNAYVNTIEYITIATTGNATTFGQLTQAKGYFAGACSSSTRGVFGGGFITGTGGINAIDFITIATTGNATSFGQLTQARWSICGGCSSSTRGVFGGGSLGTSAPWTPFTNTIDYITIATTGNATDFGDLSQEINTTAACSSSTRGVFGGGYTSTVDLNTISYITIATTGNTQAFGQLTQVKSYHSACSSSTRGVFGGGYDAVDRVNTMEYITIANTSNAVAFGQLTQSRGALAACSDAHGGLA
jgi:hypothetical protein